MHNIFEFARVVEVSVSGKGRKLRLGYGVQSAIPMEFVKKNHDLRFVDTSILHDELLVDREYTGVIDPREQPHKYRIIWLVVQSHHVGVYYHILPKTIAHLLSSPIARAKESV